KTYVELRLKLPMPQGQAPREGGSAERAAGRWAVVAGGGLVVVATLLMVFLSPPPIDLDAKPADASTGNNSEKSENAGAGTPSVGKTDSPKETGSKPTAEAPGKLEPPPAHAWPMFRGPFGLGVAVHNEAPKEWDGKTKKNIRWVAPLPKPGTNSPIVWDKVVVVSGGDDQGRAIYAFDADTGKPLWEGKVGSSGDGGAKKPT